MGAIIYSSTIMAAAKETEKNKPKKVDMRQISRLLWLIPMGLELFLIGLVLYILELFLTRELVQMRNPIRTPKEGKTIKRIRKISRKTVEKKNHFDIMWSDERKVQIYIPTRIDNYNYWMGGANIADQIRGSHQFDHWVRNFK